MLGMDVGEMVLGMVEGTLAGKMVVALPVEVAESSGEDLPFVDVCPGEVVALWLLPLSEVATETTTMIIATTTNTTTMTTRYFFFALPSTCSNDARERRPSHHHCRCPFERNIWVDNYRVRTGWEEEFVVAFRR